MRRAYQAFGWGLVLLGALHMVTTFRVFDAMTGSAVWFFGAGIAMALTGTLNLLNAIYGHAAHGLRRTTIASNLVLVVYASLAGVASRAPPAEFMIIVGLVAGTAVLSLRRRAAGMPPNSTT
jgi:hypothetical protein